MLSVLTSPCLSGTIPELELALKVHLVMTHVLLSLPSFVMCFGIRILYIPSKLHEHHWLHVAGCMKVETEDIGVANT